MHITHKKWNNRRTSMIQLTQGGAYLVYGTVIVVVIRVAAS